MTTASADTVPPPTVSSRHRLETILLGRFSDAGYARIEPPVLQDAAVFLDLGGEDIRAALYFTSDRGGGELCLRPEYTIPACRHHLASGAPHVVAGYAYFGPVFRATDAGGGEVLQAGIENFGRTDTAAADAEILALALEGAAAAGAPRLALRLGDVGLFSALLDALALPALWQRRLRRGLDHGVPLAAVLDGAPGGVAGHSGVLAALAGADGRDARALVEDLLSIAGLSAIGGRSVGEIAERFLAQVSQQTTAGFSSEKRAILEAFLAIAGDPDAASSRLRALAAEAGLSLGPVLDLFDERTGFFEAQGIDTRDIAFSTRFGRSLDYYTGFVFEARPADHADGPVMIGGGRYDRLARALGSPVEVPAVGAALWVERLGAGDAGR